VLPTWYALTIACAVVAGEEELGFLPALVSPALASSIAAAPLSVVRHTSRVSEGLGSSPRPRGDSTYCPPACSWRADDCCAPTWWAAAMMGRPRPSAGSASVSTTLLSLRQACTALLAAALLELEHVATSAPPAPALHLCVQVVRGGLGQARPKLEQGHALPGLGQAHIQQHQAAQLRCATPTAQSWLPSLCSRVYCREAGHTRHLGAKGVGFRGSTAVRAWPHGNAGRWAWLPADPQPAGRQAVAVC
jgi:hypothetical protein